jgi:hypothetical protein
MLRLGVYWVAGELSLVGSTLRRRTPSSSMFTPSGCHCAQPTNPPSRDSGTRRWIQRLGGRVTSGGPAATRLHKFLCRR